MLCFIFEKCSQGLQEPHGCDKFPEAFVYYFLDDLKLDNTPLSILYMWSFYFLQRVVGSTVYIIHIVLCVQNHLNQNFIS